MLGNNLLHKACDKNLNKLCKFELEFYLEIFHMKKSKSDAFNEIATNSIRDFI